MTKLADVGYAKARQTAHPGFPCGFDSRRRHEAAWCNGNTSDFDSDIVGSSPAAAAIWEINPKFIKCLKIGFPTNR